jgi:hypothetical protein
VSFKDEMKRTPNAGPLFAEPEEDFSLVLGGPLYQFWRRLHAAGPTLDLLMRRMIGIPLVAWLPLLVLTVYEGVAIGRVPVPFLYDLDAHARFLVAIPLLLLAEVVIHQRIRPVVRQFVDAGIVTPQVLPGFRAAIDRAMRLRNSLAVESILAVGVFGFGWMLWTETSSLTTSTWYTIADPAGRHSTLAGRWYLHVSIPIFQFLFYRWYFRLFVWFLFLGRVSRLDLRLTPTHPDRAGGLGFLASAPIAFALVILAQAIVVSSVIAGRIIFQGDTLQANRYVIAGFVILQLLLVLGPLCVFAPKLLALKRRGRREYGALAARYTREFHEKWIGGAAPPDEPLLGSADIQSLADLANSYEVVRGIRPVPFGRDAIIQVAVPALIPFAPLALTVVPAEEILKKLLGMLL